MKLNRVNPKRNGSFHASFLLLQLLLLLGLAACGGQKTVLYAGEAEPADFGLSNTKPEMYAFTIPDDHKGPFDVAIELTYFENQMQGWDALPLYYVLVAPDGKETEHRFSLSVKGPDGKWRGELKENNADRFFEETVQKGVALAPGKYTLKLFGDIKDLSKPILGIVRVIVKILE
jgi:hypothetical protein